MCAFLWWNKAWDTEYCLFLPRFEYVYLYLIGETLTSLSLYPDAYTATATVLSTLEYSRVGGTDIFTSSGHHLQRCCFHTDRPTCSSIATMSYSRVTTNTTQSR